MAGKETIVATQLPATVVSSAADMPSYAGSELPARIDRYIIRSVLGRGGYGQVYLAIDEQLQRQVAIKVPLAGRIVSPQDTQSYLAEAQMLAQLDHPHIVPVYDVGSTPEHAFYIVSKFVEGTHLAARARQSRPTFAEAARLVAIIAEALHYAHGKGLVHRDVKPGNILLDRTETPFLTDFGVALRDADFGKGSTNAGTPAYMSPEQARGEGHRVDGRSDVYSLGVVFYELLTGRRTFVTESVEDLLQQIAALDPKPPRQLNDSIPRELERICLKALSKRISERYTTALDMAADLYRFLETHAVRIRPAGEFAARHPAADTDSGTFFGDPVCADVPTVKADPEPVRVIPKGLRSFDEHDASFFLELVPGPRDRDGLPEILRFWKTRIEATGADGAFPIGLIYGPSGCGKSSLIKAGLLPRLSNDVLHVYIEATREGTEQRLLNALRRCCPDLEEGLNLGDALASLRRRSGVPAGKKVLIVLDQFEQWLHARKEEDYATLAQPLRQCDGGNVQCIALVRDDFWMAVTRFMRELEVRLVENQNVAAVDLFSERHAEDVLARFGRAYGALPAKAADVTDDQLQFLKRSVRSLAEGGKVVCVRLSLFAEMMKFKPWSQETLKQVGGAEGIGVVFLDEAFGSAGASPERRYHAQAARGVLKALLPEPGADIKGRMKSRGELLAASGYADRPRDFDELIEILDGDVRLITPADSFGKEAPATESHAESHAGSRGEHYQLTHDYTVPSLREWLTRKQKETIRGRAELRLADCAAFWSARPMHRHLPSLWDSLRIVIFTSRSNWTEAEARMMSGAGRLHGTRLVVACLLLVALLFVAREFRSRAIERETLARVEGLVDQLMVAEVAELPAVVAQLDRMSAWGDSRLAAIADDAHRVKSDRMRATFALARGPGERAVQLIESAATADALTVVAIRDRLSSFLPELRDELWDAAQRDGVPPEAMLRLGILLAAADPQAEGWNEIAPTIVDALLAEDAIELDRDVDLLYPASQSLTPVVRDRFYDGAATSATRTAAAGVLARYADVRLLNQLLLDADAPEFRALFGGTTRQKDEIAETMRQSLREEMQRRVPDDPSQTRRLKNAAAALLRLGDPRAAEPVLTNSADPTARTGFLLEARELDVAADELIGALSALTEPTARQALLLALGAYGKDLSPAAEQALSEQIATLMQPGGSQAERSAAEWLLRHWGRNDTLGSLTVSPELPGSGDAILSRGGDWWKTGQGHIMTVIRGPIDVASSGERTIPYDFAVSAHEVTVEQFLQFNPSATFPENASDTLNPASRISFDDAIAYCRWLSEQEGFSEDEQVYPADEQPVDSFLAEDRLRKPGYRLLTTEEWGCICRAGAATRWFTGTDEAHLVHFAWYTENARDGVRSVGLLRPNPFGVFDSIGNVSEWCHSTTARGTYCLVGGAYHALASGLRSGAITEQSENGFSYTGFRIARTLKPPR